MADIGFDRSGLTGKLGRCEVIIYNQSTLTVCLYVCLCLHPLYDTVQMNVYVDGGNDQ